MTYVEYKQLNPFQRFAYNTKKFFCNIPHAVAHFFTALGKAIVKFFVGIGKGFANYGKTFVKGALGRSLQGGNMFCSPKELRQHSSCRL